MAGKPANHGCMKAPAYLPHGATVTDLFASVYDNDGSEDIQVNLYRLDNYAGGTTVMASVATTGPFTSVNIESLHDDTISDATVTYPNYSYYVTTCVDAANIRLYSVRIYYSGP